MLTGKPEENLDSARSQPLNAVVVRRPETPRLLSLIANFKFRFSTLVEAFLFTFGRNLRVTTANSRTKHH